MHATNYFNSFMPHVELPGVIFYNFTTILHWLAFFISALCPCKKDFIFSHQSTPWAYSAGGRASCDFLFSGQLSSMWVRKLKNHLWWFRVSSTSYSKQKLYFDCVYFCLQSLYFLTPLLHSCVNARRPGNSASQQDKLLYGKVSLPKEV